MRTHPLRILHLILTASRMCQITLVTGACIVICRPHPINIGGIPLVADKVTVGCHLYRLVTIGTHHGADTMTASPYCHLSLAEMTISPHTVKVVMDRHESPPPTGWYYWCGDSVSRMPPCLHSHSLPCRESAWDQDHSCDYDRRRDDSQDRYRDHQH